MRTWKSPNFQTVPSRWSRHLRYDQLRVKRTTSSPRHSWTLDYRVPKMLPSSNLPSGLLDFFKHGGLISGAEGSDDSNLMFSRLKSFGGFVIVLVVINKAMNFKLVSDGIVEFAFLGINLSSLRLDPILMSIRSVLNKMINRRKPEPNLVLDRNKESLKSCLATTPTLEISSSSQLAGR